MLNRDGVLGKQVRCTLLACLLVVNVWVNEFGSFESAGLPRSWIRGFSDYYVEREALILREFD